MACDSARNAGACGARSCQPFTQSTLGSCALIRTENHRIMDSKSAEFTSLLVPRLCHDLLSPIGALNNGIELLADEHDPEMRERCMESLAESAKTSATKLKFFRLAFGATGWFDDEIDTRGSRPRLRASSSPRAGRNWIGWSNSPRCPRQRSKFCSIWR